MYVAKVFEQRAIASGYEVKQFSGFILSNSCWNTRKKYTHNGIFYDINTKTYCIIRNSFFMDGKSVDNIIDALSLYKKMVKEYPEDFNNDEKAFKRFINKISLYEKGKLIV
ncbi:MAG: hypothetical protein IKO49_01140 [Bacilli bacterium]|nr:hypothetical protein [Clostridia bacterium]MBR2240142.1 hypothetical protein [Clostridia bacterium]MBR4617903.1 hypothetical protein [Bacilli bacterium]